MRDVLQSKKVSLNNLLKFSAYIYFDLEMRYCTVVVSTLTKFPIIPLEPPPPAPSTTSYQKHYNSNPH